jgi:hypothetical protein
MTKAEKVIIEIIDPYVSRKRFSTYLRETNNDFEKAIQLYQTNIHFSEAFYPLLSILEISLRNAINHGKKIADCLHRIRKLRNRIYHYEPIIIKLNETKQIYDEIKIFIGWINKEILLILIPAERINWVIQKNN